MNDQALKIVKGKASLWQFFRDPVGFFRSISGHDGSITEISLGGRRFYILSDPAIIRDILTTRGSLFEKFPQGNPKQKLFGAGLLTSEGAAQKRQRRMLLPGFHRDRLQVYAQEMAASVERLSACWQTNQGVDIAQEMNELTLEIIGRTLLGVHDRSVMAELGAHLHTMLSMVNRFVVPWGDWLMKMPLGSTLRYRNAVKRLDELVYRLIEKARQQEDSDSMIGMLLTSNLTDSEIRDEVVTMVVAGHETVAVGLTWSLFLLACRPDLQDELSAQVTEALGQRNPAASDYSNLEFLQHVFSESLRLHPPIWILGRRNLEEYAFRNFTAPQGSIFLVCMADLHRRSEFFADAERFHPQRWKNPDWPAYAYIPFGGGERRCIGERFAWMEAVFVLACLLRRWKFTAVDSKEPVADAKLTLHPRGPVPLLISERRLIPSDFRENPNVSV